MGKHSDFHPRVFQKLGAWRDFYSCYKTDETFKSVCGLGGRCLKIRDVCMDFEPYFKVHNLVSVHPKSIILGQMSKWSFMRGCQFIDLLKIWNSPQFETPKVSEITAELCIAKFNNQVGMNIGLTFCTV